MSIEVRLDQFSGPLDLLLHLIKSNEMDIYDIRIVEITEQYLDVIDQMKKLDLDVAGEFLLMAATLIHIKSRMLLPVSEDLEEEEGQDPREELIKRLLEYQRYKEAAELFQELPQLERDVFSSAFKIETLIDDDGDQQQIAIGIYQLADAFHKLIKSKPPEVFHEVVQETLSVAAYIEFIVDSLRGQTRQSFKSFFVEAASRDEIVVTFLAMLELVKMRMINVEQVDDFTDVWISAAVPDDQLDAAIFDRQEAGYE